jgi:hypothetical protein
LAASLPTLRRLQIFCRRSDNAITPAAIATLADAPALEEVEFFSATPVDEGVGGAIASIPSLTRLYLRHNAVTPEGIRALARLCPLTSLRVTDTSTFDDAAAAAAGLAAMASLEELDVSRTGVTAGCLGGVARLGRLRRLTLTGTGITTDDLRRAGVARSVVVIGAAGG